MSGLRDQEQVRQLARRVGAKPREARILSAIALCESPASVDGVPHADFNAVGDEHLANEVYGYSYGAWQIRSLRAHKGTGKYRDEERLLEPRFNAESALKVAREEGWERWTTYANGQYRAYLPDLFPPAPGTHVVVYGDTLSGIAAQHGGFTWERLAEVNNLSSPYRLYIGQVLDLPAGS